MPIAESLSAYLPYGLAAVVVMLVFGIWTYLPWTAHGAIPRQRPFLNVPFLYIRTLVGLGQLVAANRRTRGLGRPRQGIAEQLLSQRDVPLDRLV